MQNRMSETVITGDNMSFLRDRATEPEVKSEEVFDEGKTIKEMASKLTDIIAAHMDTLSGVTKADFHLLTQNILNQPGVGDAIKLIDALFSKWGQSTNPGIAEADLRQVGLDIDTEIDNLSDDEFFGSMQNTEENRNKLLLKLRQLSNSKFSPLVTIIESQTLKRGLDHD